MGFTWEPISTDLREVEIMTSIAFFFDQEMRGKVFGSIYRALEILKDHPESYPISKNTFESRKDEFQKKVTHYIFEANPIDVLSAESNLEEIIDFTQYIYTRFFCFFHFPTDVPGTSQNSNSTEKNSETEDKSYFFIRNIKLPIIVYPILAAIIANLDKKVVRTDYRKFKENILSTTLSIYPYYNEYAEKKLKREIPLSDKLLQKFYALFIDLLYPNELIDVLHQNYLDPSVVKLLLSRHILDTSFFCTRGGQSYFYRKLDEKIHQRIIGFFTIDDLFIIRKNIQDKEAQLFGDKKPRDIWRSYQNEQL